MLDDMKAKWGRRATDLGLDIPLKAIVLALLLLAATVAMHHIQLKEMVPSVDTLTRQQTTFAINQGQIITRLEGMGKQLDRVERILERNGNGRNP